VRLPRRMVCISWAQRSTTALVGIGI
jgi:hypothetical protein